MNNFNEIFSLSSPEQVNLKLKLCVMNNSIKSVRNSSYERLDNPKEILSVCSMLCNHLSCFKTMKNFEKYILKTTVLNKRP